MQSFITVWHKRLVHKMLDIESFTIRNFQGFRVSWGRRPSTQAHVVLTVRPVYMSVCVCVFTAAAGFWEVIPFYPAHIAIMHSTHSHLPLLSAPHTLWSRHCLSSERQAKLVVPKRKLTKRIEFEKHSLIEEPTFMLPTVGLFLHMH